MAAKTGESTMKKSGGKLKKFNLCTYKLHTLADYAKTIRLFSITNNYNSQVVCCTWFVRHLPKTELPDQGELEH